MQTLIIPTVYDAGLGRVFSHLKEDLQPVSLAPLPLPTYHSTYYCSPHTHCWPLRTSHAPHTRTHLWRKTPAAFAVMPGATAWPYSPLQACSASVCTTRLFLPRNGQCWPSTLAPALCDILRRGAPRAAATFCCTTCNAPPRRHVTLSRACTRAASHFLRRSGILLCLP